MQFLIHLAHSVLLTIDHTGALVHFGVFVKRLGLATVFGLEFFKFGIANRLETGLERMCETFY